MEKYQKAVIQKIKPKDILEIPDYVLTDMSDFRSKNPEDFGIALRKTGDFQYKGLLLSSSYNWKIVEDSNGFIVLLRLKK